MEQINWILHVKDLDTLQNIQNVSSQPKSETDTVSSVCTGKKINHYTRNTHVDVIDIFNNGEIEKILNSKKLCRVIEPCWIIWKDKIHVVFCISKVLKKTLTIIFWSSFPIDIWINEFNLLRSIVEQTVSIDGKQSEN